MPDAPDPPETAAFSEQDDSTATPDSSAVSGQSPGMLRAPFTVGQRWRTYQIGDPLPSGEGWLFHAINVGMLEDVLIRVLPITEQTQMRANAWQELQSLTHAGLIKGMDAYEEDEYRYEVSHPTPPTTLKEWASCRQAALEDVEILIKQLASALATLHDRGVVHLNLRPDTIFMMTAETGLQVTIGGMEHATVYNQAELIPMPVDPLYAPPEAAGLAKHPPGAGLRAWDWWSLGRVIQEIVLGRHAIGLLMNREVSRLTPEIRSRAETLLLERDPRAPRAGAVELMPPMNQRLNDLLRGLLTSSRDGRWGTDEVERWLGHVPVKDRYQLGRNETLFGWKDRMFTVAEAAEYFSREENWADGIVNLFEVDDPSTLVHFVGEKPEYGPVRERIGEWHKFMQVSNWTGLPVEATRVALASAVWLLLGGEGMKLVVCGRRLDATCLKSLLARGSAVDGVALIRAMTALPFVQMIEQADPEAARLLSSLAGLLSSEAITRAVREGWVDQANDAECVRLFLLALESDQRLVELRGEVRGRFACTRNERLHALFSNPAPSRADLVLLACTAAQPDRFAYVSHADWNDERHAALREQGGQVATALFWLRLERALWLGWPVSGRWTTVAGGWLLLAAAVAYFGRGAWAVAAVAGFVSLRLVLVALVRHLIRRQTTAAAPWNWTSPIARCRIEAGVAMEKSEAAPTLHDVARKFAAFTTDLAALKLSPAPAPLRRPVSTLPVWAVAVAMWSVLFAGVFQQDWLFGGRATDPRRSAVPDLRADAAAALEATRSSPTAAKPTPEELFFDDPRVPRMPWNVLKPASAPPLTITRTRAASSDQVAAALIDGQKLLQSYDRNSVNTLIAIPVNAETGAGLLIYDVRNRRVVERQVLLTEQLPADQSWFALEDVKIFYVGEPLQPAKPVVKTAAEPPADLPEREVRRSYPPQPDPAEEKATNAQPATDATDSMAP